MELMAFSNMIHKLRCVEQKLTKGFEKSTGFSITRYEILIYLKKNGNKLQREIAQYLNIDPAAITRHIKILEKKGYITKTRNKENEREVIISLTDFAKLELKKCQNNHCENKCDLPIPFTQEEIDKTLEILEQIEKKLE